MSGGVTPTGRVVGAVVRAEWTRLARDRTAAFFFLLVPFLVILLVGLSFGGADVSSLPVGVVAPDTPLAARLVDRLGSADELTVEAYDDEEALRTALRRQHVLGGVLLAPDHDARALAGDAEVALVTGPQGGTPGALQRTVDSAVAQEGAALAAVTAALDVDDVDGVLAGLQAVDDMDGGAAVAVRQPGEAEVVIPVGFQGSAARNLVLFLFITSLVGGQSVVQARRLGILHRGLAAPTSAGRLLGGQAVAALLVVAGQGLVVVVGSALLFGVTWQDWPATLAVVGLFSLVGTGVSMLVGAVVRGEQQVESIGPPVGIALGMLGGCMWPLEIVPQAMRVVGHLTPHAWAVDALNAVQGRQAGIGEIATELAALALYALVLAVAAVVLLRRTMTRA